MAVTVTQKDTKEAGGAVPSHKRRMQSIREEAMYCVVQAVYPPPHTHTYTLLAFPNNQVLTGHSRAFESPCQCPSWSAVRFKFGFSVWKKKKKVAI